jgi:hypothetical protein
VKFRSAPVLRWLRVARSALLVEAGLRTRPLDELTRLLGITLRADTSMGRANPLPLEISSEVSWAFQATDRLLWFLSARSQCLRRTLIAGHLLREHKPSLYIGSAKLDGNFAFHAWLELDGHVAADADALRYRRLVRIGPS